MTSFIISKEANDYLIKKKKGRRFPKIVIYRDVSGIILGYTTTPVKFIPRVKMTYDEPPNEIFSLVNSTSNGISVWLESVIAFMGRSVQVSYYRVGQQ